LQKFANTIAMNAASLPHQFQDDDLLEVISHWPLRDNPSCHGPDHWIRVYNNAMLLADDEGWLEGRYSVCRDALYWASLFHDSMRINEYDDDGHGGRGAAHLTRYYLSEVSYDGDQDDVLSMAVSCCALHTDLMPDNEALLCAHLSDMEMAVVRLFCDADRLDLDRLGYKPDPNRMFTHAGKERAVNLEETSYV